MVAVNALRAEHQLRERQLEQRPHLLAGPVVAQRRAVCGGKPRRFSKRHNQTFL